MIKINTEAQRRMKKTLSLCDKDFNAEGQRSRGAEGQRGNIHIGDAGLGQIC